MRGESGERLRVSLAPKRDLPLKEMDGICQGQPCPSQSPQSLLHSFHRHQHMLRFEANVVERRLNVTPASSVPEVNVRMILLVAFLVLDH